MAKITVLYDSSVTGTSYSFGAGFNVNGTSVQFALDDPSNMLYNPGFEDSPALSNWNQTSSGAFTRGTAVVFQGTYSAQTNTANSYLTQTFHCDPGDQHIFNSYMAASSGGNSGFAQFYIIYHNGAGAQVGSASGSIGPSTSWQFASISGTAPSTAATVTVWLGAYTGSTGTWYFDNASLRRISLGNNIAVGVVSNINLVPGQTSITVTTGLPTLPNASYPNGIVIFNTADGDLFKNSSGTWKNLGDPAGLIAGQLAAGVIYAGVVNASQVNAGTFNGLFLVLSLNGITTTINNALGTSGNYTGVKITDTQGNDIELHNQGISGFSSGGTTLTDSFSLLVGGGASGGGQLNLNGRDAGVYINGFLTLGPRYMGISAPELLTTLSQLISWSQTLYTALLTVGIIGN